MGHKMSKGGEGRSSESRDVDKPRQAPPSNDSIPSREQARKKHAKTQRNLKHLPPDVLKNIGAYVSPRDMQTAELELSKPSGRIRFFQSTLDELSVLNDVLTGNLESLIAAVRTNPALLFIKSDNITDPAGQVFYNVSPYHMMLFLCDDDMLNQVMRAVSPLPETLIEQIKRIHAELQQGGADLVKFDRDPRLLNFEDILRFRTSYTLYNGTIIAVTFPLLENPDGVLYYKDELNQEHWFYANQATRTIEPIELAPRFTLAQQEAYTKLVTQMNAMAPMSARRSSNDEHQFIANHMCYLENAKTMTSVQLVRFGMTYIQDGIRYRDTRYDFNRYTNAYRKCIGLYAQQRWNEGDRVWQRELGHVQKEVMWLLQRYCEEDCPFYPLSIHYKSEPFRRGFKFKNWVGRGGRMDDIYNANTGDFCEGFGANFGLYKLAQLWGAGSRWLDAAPDLVAVTRLVEYAKTNVGELLNSDLTQRGPAPR
jgi:hypothetical protein